MKTIQKVLNQDLSSKTKKELEELMKNLQTLISPEEYEKVSAVDPKEFSDLRKNEILDVIEDFKQNYKEDWESSARRNTEVLTQLVKGIDAIVLQDDAFFNVQNASNADFAAELGSIDFAKLIGGPLDACVTAQSNASLSTVNFIKEVGFEGEEANRTVRMVDFSHSRNVANPYYGGTRGEDGVPDDANVTDENITEDVTLTVPFISILNIPSLRIETCEIDFNVKLNSVYSRNVSSSFGIDAGAQGGWGPVKLNVSVAYKRSSSTGVRVEKEYSMGVKVKATNDEMPAGLEKVLGILAE